MRVIGLNRCVDYHNIAIVFVLALLFQSVAGILTAPATRLLGKRALACVGCYGVVGCILASAYYMHDYTKFLLWYSFGAGSCSGLVMSLPIDSVLRLNPRRRGLSCGVMHAIMGLALMVMGPVQMAYINRWLPGTSWRDSFEFLRSDRFTTAGDHRFFADKTILYRTRSLVVCTAAIYLITSVGHPLTDITRGADVWATMGISRTRKRWGRGHR